MKQSSCQIVQVLSQWYPSTMLPLELDWTPLPVKWWDFLNSSYSILSTIESTDFWPSCPEVMYSPSFPVNHSQKNCWCQRRKEIGNLELCTIVYRLWTLSHSKNYSQMSLCEWMTNSAHEDWHRNCLLKACLSSLALIVVLRPRLDWKLDLPADIITFPRRMSELPHIQSSYPLL